MDELPHGKVKVVETDSNKMVTVDITIDDSFDLLKVFHAGVDCGEKASQPKLA